jgi:hypothetical protein
MRRANNSEARGGLYCGTPGEKKQTVVPPRPTVDRSTPARFCTGSFSLPSRGPGKDGGQPYCSCVAFQKKKLTRCELDKLITVPRTH